MSLSRLLLLGGILTAGVGIMRRLRRAEQKIGVVVGGKIHKVDLSGLTIRLSFNLKNPANVSMTFAPPLIVISVNGNQIATSNMKTMDIPEQYRDSVGRIIIPANNETGNITTDVNVPFLGLLPLIPDLLQIIKDRQKKSATKNPTEQKKESKKIQINVEVRSTVYTSVGSFPYDSKQVITI